MTFEMMRLACDGCGTEWNSFRSGNGLHGILDCPYCGLPNPAQLHGHWDDSGTWHTNHDHHEDQTKAHPQAG